MELGEIIKLHKNNELDRAEKEYLKLLESFPDDARLLKYLGMLYLQKQDIENAKKYLTKSCELSPERLTTENIALIFYSEKNYPLAQKYFEKMK